MVRTSQKQLREDGRQVVVQLLRKRGWRLVPDIDQFVEEVLATLELEDVEGPEQDAEATRKLVKREAIRRYCIIMHESSQANGTQRQKRAFEESWAYLFPLALYKTEDEAQAQEYTQQALIKIWQKGNQCTDPGRFLGWARVVLLNEIRMGIRGNKEKATTTWTDMSAEDQEDLWEQKLEKMISGEKVPLRPPEDSVIRNRLIQRLREALGVALHSPAQRAVIEGLFIEGLGFGSIAEKLDTTPSNVHVLKSRALAHLRQDEQFRRTLLELLEE
jgi:RNA polymerase sigma factor (sigma-70 family)